VSECAGRGDALEGQGVQEQAERKQPTKRQSNQPRDASLGHGPASGSQALVERAGDSVQWRTTDSPSRAAEDAGDTKKG